MVMIVKMPTGFSNAKKYPRIYGRNPFLFLMLSQQHFVFEIFDVTFFVFRLNLAGRHDYGGIWSFCEFC